MTSPSNADRPLITVIIISYNMAREVPRTVQSFLPPYQKNISNDDIEIIVMENGSSAPIDPEIVQGWPECVRYIQVDDPKPSPANALNQGVAMARGEWVCPVIDGARMITPGVIHQSHTLMRAHPNPVIATIGYHLGHKTQQENVLDGYNQAEEDALLESIGWPNNAYNLFKISSLGGSAKGGWLSKIAESNVLILKKDFYLSIGGYDERFDTPGGGLVNLDFFKRSVEHESSQYVMLLGEGSFHQYHGGVTTSRAVNLPSLENKKKTTWELYSEEYIGIRGEAYKVPQEVPFVYGKATSVVRTQTIEAALYINSLQSK